MPDTQADNHEDPARGGEKPYAVRHAERVQVRLRVALEVLDVAYVTESVDLSESGIMIRNYAGPPLSAGENVDLRVRGILCDEDNHEHRLTMSVVRASEGQVALTFFDN